MKGGLNKMNSVVTVRHINGNYQVMVGNEIRSCFLLAEYNKAIDYAQQFKGPLLIVV